MTKIAWVKNQLQITASLLENMQLKIWEHKMLYGDNNCDMPVGEEMVQDLMCKERNLLARRGRLEKYAAEYGGEPRGQLRTF